jgi:hypothetical protein
MFKKSLTLLIITLCAVTVPFTFSSCDKLKDLISPIDLVLKSKDIPITIPASAAGQQQAFASINFDLAAELAKSNTSSYTLKASNIKTAKLKSISIDIVGGGSVNNNFANFKDGGVYFGTNANANTTSKFLFAQVLNNPDVYSTHIDFIPQGNTDLKDHLMGTVFDYLYAYELRRPLTSALQAIIHIEYDIQIQP